jgi:hypothetical protein
MKAGVALSMIAAPREKKRWRKMLEKRKGARIKEM